jgi:hypothetical protein
MGQENMVLRDRRNVVIIAASYTLCVSTNQGTRDLIVCRVTVWGAEPHIILFTLRSYVPYGVRY